MFVKGLMLDRLTVSVLGALMFAKDDALRRTVVDLKVCDTTSDENNLRRFLEASIRFNPTAHNWTPAKFLHEQLPWLGDVRVPHYSDDMDTAARQHCFDKWLEGVTKSWAAYRKEHGITSLSNNTIEVMALLPETIESLKQAEAAEQAAAAAAKLARETEFEAARAAAKTTPTQTDKADDATGAASTETAQAAADNPDNKTVNGHSTDKANPLTSVKNVPIQADKTNTNGTLPAPITHVNGATQTDKVLVGV